MAVVIETTIGDITVDLFVKERPQACLNFIKLCKLKYYNFNLFHSIQPQFIAQTGDPTGQGDGGESIWGVLEGPRKRYFEAEMIPKIRHTEPGLLSMVGAGKHLIGSQFFFTLAEELQSLDGVHCVIGEVTEGHEVLRKLNETICDSTFRPYKDIRITHTVVLDDPFPDPRGFREPSQSPLPSAERMAGGRIAADEDIDDTEGKTEAEIIEMIQAREAKARATILEIVGDIPDADVAPPENVLFVCKLNPVTTDEDLQIIFSRFGKIKSAEVIRDRITGDSLQYAFIEFEEQKSCEEAYFKMDNVLIDDRRIHVDFSQSVAKIKWKGKGRWTIQEEDEVERKGPKRKDKRRSMSKERPRSRERRREERQRLDVRDKVKSRREDQHRRSKSIEHQRRKMYPSPRNRRDYREEEERRHRERSREKRHEHKSRKKRRSSSGGSSDREKRKRKHHR